MMQQGGGAQGPKGRHPSSPRGGSSAGSNGNMPNFSLLGQQLTPYGSIQQQQPQQQGQQHQNQKLVVKIFDENADQEKELLGCCQIFLKDMEPGVLTEKLIRLVEDLDKEDRKSRGEGDSQDGTGSPSGSRRASLEVNEDLKFQDSDLAHSVRRGFSYKGQLCEVVRGVFTVMVERAENLVSKDILSLSDPYLVLKMRKSRNKKQTKVVYKNLNPEWNQTFDFMVEDGINEMLLIKVWDHDTFGRDFLGSYETNLTKAIHMGECKAEFKLSDVPSGVIFLTLKWIPMPMESRRSSVHKTP